MGKEEEERQLRRELRRIERKKQERFRQLLLVGMFGIAALIAAAAVLVFLKGIFWKEPVDPHEVPVPEWVTENLLTPNPYSRPITSRSRP